MNSKSDPTFPQHRKLVKALLGWLEWFVACCALFYLGKHHYHIINVNLFLSILLLLSLLLVAGLLWISNRFNDASKADIQNV